MFNKILCLLFFVRVGIAQEAPPFYFNTPEITSCGKYQVLGILERDIKLHRDILKIYPKTLKEVEFFIKGPFPMEVHRDNTIVYFLEILIDNLQKPEVTFQKLLDRNKLNNHNEEKIMLVEKTQCSK